MSMWKLVGLAGLAGVAATGAVIARDERKRQAYSPDEVRSRLHERAADVGAVPQTEAAGTDPTSPGAPAPAPGDAPASAEAEASSDESGAGAQDPVPQES